MRHILHITDRKRETLSLSFNGLFRSQTWRRLGVHLFLGYSLVRLTYFDFEISGLFRVP